MNNVYIIAEAGVNHNGSIELAKKLVECAASAGADAVKFQTFTAENIVIRTIDFPPEAGGGNQFEEFKRYELSEENHSILFSHAYKKGLIPFSTPSSPDDVRLLERLNVVAYKTGADDLTVRPFQLTAKPVFG